MAIPFKVFDHSYYWPGHLWCVRCETWIPLDAAAGRNSDPHVNDHIGAYLMLDRIARDFKGGYGHIQLTGRLPRALH